MPANLNPAKNKEQKIRVPARHMLVAGCSLIQAAGIPYPAISAIVEASTVPLRARTIDSKSTVSSDRLLVAGSGAVLYRFAPQRIA